MDDHEGCVGQSNAAGLAADLCPVPVTVQDQAQVQGTAAPRGAAAVGPGRLRCSPDAPGKVTCVGV